MNFNTDFIFFGTRNVAQAIHFCETILEGQPFCNGIKVLFFLVLMFFVTLWLKNEYWKDVK